MTDKKQLSSEMIKYYRFGKRTVLVALKSKITDMEDDTIKLLIFNRTNTNKTKWFSQDKILNSSWTDLSESGDAGS